MTTIIKKTLEIKSRSFKLVDFHIFDEVPTDDSSSSSDDDEEDSQGRKKYKKRVDKKTFMIQIFGVNERGETVCLYINDYSPFFFIKVPEFWTQRHATEFTRDIKKRVGDYYENSILDFELSKYHKLYGFSGGKKENFIKLVFKNMACMNKVKSMFYETTPDGDRKLKAFIYPTNNGQRLQIYEGNIPPLLRYFHIHNISPSGWVKIQLDRVINQRAKTTTCNYEYICEKSAIIPLNEKERRVPYKICSFDIEASSSHGDFPVPKKDYKRLAGNIVDVFTNRSDEDKKEMSFCNMLLKKSIKTAFGYSKIIGIDLVYPKTKPTENKPLITEEFIDRQIEKCLSITIEHARKVVEENNQKSIKTVFEEIKNNEDDAVEIDDVEVEESFACDEPDEDSDAEDGDGGEDTPAPTTRFYSKKTKPKIKINKNTKIIDVLLNETYSREEKIQELNTVLNAWFPPLEGDKTTFIGSTFIRYGEQEPYLNHCLVVGSCDNVEGAEIETTETEADMLVAWKDLIQKENPDIIIGYNIFGFDYEFLFRRAEELGVEREFLKLSRNKEELCAKEDKLGRLSIENSTTVLASGPYELKYPKIVGRIQIDVYNYFRREFNLGSYKLDNVAGQFISDDIKKIECDVGDNGIKTTMLYSKNLIGLHKNDYIHIELSSFTTDYYADGKKFRVLEIMKDYEVEEQVKDQIVKTVYNVIVIEGHHNIQGYKSIKWGMAKDDVSPQDIFRLANGSSADRAVVAKYCFVEGTRVSLPSCSVDIKCLENMNTDVITWVENKGFSTSQKVKFFNNGESECIEITLIDGTKIRCTNDHKFLTKNGWIEAQNLESTDKILYYPEPAFIDYDSEKLYTFKFSDLIGTLDYNKSCIFLRLLGYLLTDGGISESTCYKNYSKGKVEYVYDIAYINLGTKADAINMQKDILNLIGKSPSINKAKFTYRITMPMKLTKWFLSIDSVKKGNRLNTPALLPNFILNENCPKWVHREFLKGLMGGDGHCPTFSKKRNSFCKLGFSQSKTEENISSLINYMKDIKNIFQKFNINTTLTSTKKNACGNGYTVQININQDDLITFYENIGFAYCAGKSYKLAVASSYYKLRRETKRQFNWVCEKVKLLSKNMSKINSLKQVHLELKLNEPIYNEHYSLPGIKSLNLNLIDPTDISASCCNFNKSYFPSAEDYLKITESYEMFVTNDNKKSHSVKQDNTHTPCYYLSVLHKKNIGKHTVYDIEVNDTHNFVANGAVVHNCIQDCNLVHHLMNKIDVLTGYIEMSNICSVPISFLVFRGQGIKLTSFVAKKCREKETLMPDLDKAINDTGYEGAIVLPPKCSMYMDNPVACVDYSSLYPSSMISQNLSHDSKVWRKEYDLEGNLVKEVGDKRYDNLPGYHYIDLEFDNFEYKRKSPTSKAEKVKCGKTICRWAQFPENRKGIMPSILEELLKARSDTRKMIKTEKDPFMQNILDKRQLGYKVTANSLYGQCGSRTSTFYEKDVAASTTATGRMMIIYARRIIEEVYQNYEYKTEKFGPVLTRAEYVYGDTDSVFFTFNLQNPETKEKIVGKDALEITIEIAQDAAKLCTQWLKPPMELSYEKTLMPFILLSKKRYVGMLYETDPNKGKLKYMGLAIKRRDSCDYLKDIYGGILNILMKEQDIQKSIEFLNKSLNNLIEGGVPMEKLAITRALNSNYANPKQIAHKVLADRIAERDPGNKPKSGDRIKYLYFVNNTPKALQGEKIETPEFIIDNKLKIDYAFYITNQLMKPLQQLFGLALEQIWEKQNKTTTIKTYRSEMANLKKDCGGDLEVYSKKKEKICSQKVKAILFDSFLIKIANEKNKNREITSMFMRK